MLCKDFILKKIKKNSTQWNPMFQNGELKEDKRMVTARIRPSTASLFLIPSGDKAAKSRISMVRLEPRSMKISASGAINLPFPV